MTKRCPHCEATVVISGDFGPKANVKCSNGHVFPANAAREIGIYDVRRVDGKVDPPDADYFVLRLDGDSPWNEACRESLAFLASLIKKSHPGVASDIESKLGISYLPPLCVSIPGMKPEVVARFTHLTCNLLRSVSAAGNTDKLFVDLLDVGEAHLGVPDPEKKMS